MADSNLVINFWLDVQRQLQTEFAMSPEEAFEALNAYRRRMAGVGAIDVVYHSEPSDVARAIQGRRFTESPPR